MPTPRLTDLPIEIQSHILSNLSTPPLTYSNAFWPCTLRSAESMVEPFPDDMLHTAQASVAISKAVIHTLGSEAKFLSFLRSRRLPEWIYLLKSHVKVVSLSGCAILEYCDSDCGGLVCQCDNLHKAILKTFKALYTNNVSLEAIDLTGLDITDINRAEQIAEEMVLAIQTSSSSLEEIAIHTNRATAIALPRVTLPNLIAVHITTHIGSGHEDVTPSDISISAQTLRDILQGLSGHADRHRGVSTVRKLLLYCVQEVPIIDRKNCWSVFSAVEELHIVCPHNSRHEEISKFIANFRRLKTLVVYISCACAEDMNRIFAECPQLEDLTLSVNDRWILPDTDEIDLFQNSQRINDLFGSLRGKLRKFFTIASLSFSQIEILAMSSPNLKYLHMGIDGENVETISSLLGTHCRKLRELHLQYSAHAMSCLGPNGWPALAGAICSASEELCVFSLVGDKTGPIIESATFEMVEAIVDILEFMGDRASSIEFQVPINTDNPFVVIHAIRRTLKVAHTQCGSIDTLCLDFVRDSSFGGYSIDCEDEGRLVSDFFSMVDLQIDFNMRRDNDVYLGNIQALV